MRVGFIALGKLGFASAVAAAQRNHQVYGYDVDEGRMDSIARGTPSDFSYEPDIDQAFTEVRSRFHPCKTIEEVVEAADLLFLSPQTPHPPELDGSVRFNHARLDFDYSYLVSCCRRVAKAIKKHHQRHKVVVIVSTVLPGTTRREIAPAMDTIIGPTVSWSLIYSPSFIAQSTVVRDYKAPEFALLGHSYRSQGVEVYEDYLRTIHNAPILQMSWESAELAKVCYNTFIGFKIILANTVMELCENMDNADCDKVMGALQQARDRIVSPKYMKSGMGDGGGCHPRDNIAMAALAESCGLTYNPFDFLMTVREKQTEFLASMAIQLSRQYDMPIVVMGTAFKPGVDQEVGSPGLLLYNILYEKSFGTAVSRYDRILHPQNPFPAKKAVYVMTLNDPAYLEFPFEAGSIIIDPWGMVPVDHKGCRVIRVGRRP